MCIRDRLERYHEGLICLSACLAGEIPRYIVRGFYDEAKEIARKYQDLSLIHIWVLSIWL